MMPIQGQIRDVHVSAAIVDEAIDEDRDYDYDQDLGQLGDLQIAPHQIGGNQLTLPFQGKVYVFDSVTSEKVQAVLLLLGGKDVRTHVPSVASTSQQYNKRSNFPHRVASLMRFQEKRKERIFDKKIRYTVRKDVALRIHRNKGQFTSSKSKPEDTTQSITTWNATQGWGTVDGRPQAASECHHCGIGAKSTPMMRRGPDGPRTLCNACGLIFFKECPHLDDKQKKELSRELGLEPLQVKFWFQKKCTQMKTQHKRHENTQLITDNKKLRAENLRYKEALANASCPNCGGSAVLGEMSFDEHHLRIENAQLRE